MITTDKILAHKTVGKNLVLLSQVGNSYFLTFAKVQVAKKGILGFSKQSIQVVAEREVTKEEACHIYSELTKGHEAPTSSYIQAPALEQPVRLKQTVTQSYSKDIPETLLLTGTVSSHTPSQPLSIDKKAFVSPYFPLKEILLSVQQTRAPSIA